MAKVYSWEVNKSPKKYAYIVHPTDFTKVYVGNELKGSNLENIKNWTSSCTDTEYEQHFKMMTELCASKGYNVEFESVTAYMNVNSTCDNLRGPAGRGIDHIALLSKDSVTNISKYIIYYDDNTTDTFEIQNGKDGRDGIDGSPGAKGDSGVSSKLVMIYASGVDEYGNLFTPERPNGGSYDFTLNKIEYPVGWEPNDSKVIPPVWMSSRTFASTEASTDKQWSLPVQITGETGAPGVDGVTTEFIYYLDDIEPSVENLLSPNESGYVPPVETGWTPSPTGVDEDHLTEWCSIRKIDRAKKEWGRWEKPFIWSKYGVNGQDGDGVQYIYLKNNGTILDNPTPKDYLTNKDYQSKDSEWVPMDGVGFINIDDKLVSFKALEETTDGSAPAGVWTDNPSDLTSEYHSQWVSSRKYRKHDNGKMSWGPFSAPALWAKFGQDGKNATSIRKLYCLSTSTSNPPDVPKDSTTTGDWGTGFPIDYQVGVNVVWGIEAEIWAHNSNFVETYKMVSERDKDGNVIPPTDAMNNFRDVDAIPNEQVVGVKYLRFNEDYYEWLGGWSKPFLVTGLKGETGYVPNYTTYVYAYGHTEYPPTAPISKSAEHPGTSSDALGTEIVWLDFPDTSDGRIDGAINPVTGKEMRWYQCVGHVYGHNNEVYEWGAVTPCNGHDGANGAKGNYMEVRFGVTADGNKPDFYPYNPVTGEVYREPVLLDENGYEMGWYATDESLPDVPSGGAMWQIWALIDGETNTVVESNGKHWNGPKRVSGEKGEQGVQGPAGMRGVTGIPGATSIQLYCLGTYGNNENSESYWETGGINGGDGYFGSDNWKNDAFVNDMSGWYKSKEMPYSDILTAYDEAELEHISSQPINKGRVVRLIESETETVGPTDSESMFTNTTHTYYLIDNTNSYEQLTQPLAPSEEFNVYVWAIQGTEKWEAGLTSKYVDVTKYDTDGNVIVPDDAEGQSVILNGVPSEKQELYKYVICENKYYEWKEIDGDKVEHTLTGIEWGSPFKLQGTNGLRGLSGSRGQVVYPMGVYNQEEVYITTEDKAPYVYDSNDGMYYVYNDTTRPWVGVLPGYDPDTKVQGNLYKTILIHPDDAESSFLAIDYDPTSDMQVEEVPGYKYLYYSGKYYIWNGSNYALASRYKYSIDGSGMEGTWMSSQHGDSPANNYANATNSFNQPAWVRFESFKALYTSIGIIENGMIGSAVYNNEFMFSQQGVDMDGTPTTYAVVSGTNTEYGFLSGYQYDEDGEYVDGVPTGRHWHYRDFEVYIDNDKVNPYEVVNETNKTYFSSLEMGQPIHTFMPNVCINFATGQMWTSCGRSHFNSDGTGYLASKSIKWWFSDDDSIAIQIGYDGENGIKFEDGTLTVGVLEAYKAVVSTEIQSLTDSTSQQIGDLTTLLNDNVADLQAQIDKKAETFYGPDIPSTDWPEASYSTHVGDMWYNTSNTNGYALNCTYRWNGTQWIKQDIPASVFDRIDGKASIYVTKPTTDNDGDGYIYKKGDMWFLEADYIRTTELGSTGKTGSIWVAQNSRTPNNFNWSDWIKKGTELDNWVNSEYSSTISDIRTQVDAKASCYYQSTDPSVNWTTDTELHIGDLWFDTNSNMSYMFTNVKPTTSGNENVSEYKNATITGYYWVSSNVPSSVFDRFDGKSTIFVDTPNSDTDGDGYLYHKSDLWLKDGEIYRATVTRTKTEGYKAADWIKACDYTDDTVAQQAIARFDGWADDGYISPQEVKSLRDELAIVKKEHESLNAQATTYGLNVSTSDYNTTYNNYIKAYNAALLTFNYYTSVRNAVADATSPYFGSIKIAKTGVSTTDTTGQYYGNIANYYGAKQDLQNALVSCAYNNSDDYVDDLKEVFGSVIVNKGATLTGYLGVTDADTGDVTTALDGSGMVTKKRYNWYEYMPEHQDIPSKLVFAAGIPDKNNLNVSGSPTLAQKMDLAKTKIYDDGTFITQSGDIKGNITATGGEIGPVKVGYEYLLMRGAESNAKNQVLLSENYGVAMTSNGFDGYYVNASFGYQSGGVQYDAGGENSQMAYFKPGLMVEFSDTKAGYSDTNPNTTYAYLHAVYIDCNTHIKNTRTGGKTEYNNHAIYCPRGTFAGLRPKMTYITSGTHTLTEYEHTIVLNNTSTDTAINIYLPSNPQDGQEYVIYQVHRGGDFNVISNSKGIFSMNANKTTQQDSYTAKVNRYVNIVYCAGLGQWISRYGDYGG